jgi:hypothetical protein
MFSPITLTSAPTRSLFVPFSFNPSRTFAIIKRKNEISKENNNTRELETNVIGEMRACKGKKKDMFTSLRVTQIFWAFHSCYVNYAQNKSTYSVRYKTLNLRLSSKFVLYMILSAKRLRCFTACRAFPSLNKEKRESSVAGSGSEMFG